MLVRASEMRNINAGLYGLAAMLTSACFPGLVTAEEAPAAQPSTRLGKIVVEETAEPAYTVENTTSATKLDLSLRDTPQSVTVFTRERLDDQQMQTLRSVLDYTPGVYTYQYDTERIVFSARGFTIDNLMYDGVPAVTNFSTDSIDDTIDTAPYERIEIVRGATGLMSGVGSPAASVNLVRKHATSRDLQIQLDLTGGSWNDRRGEADISAPLNADGSIRGRLVGVYQERDSYQDLYHLEKRVLYGILDADLSERTHASLGFDFVDNDPRSNTWGSFPLFLGDGTPANWARSVTTSTDWAFWDRRTRSAFGEITHQLDSGWKLRGTASFRKFNEDLALFYMYGFPDPVTGGGLEPYANRTKSEIKETSVDVSASGPFEAFGRTHELIVGYNGTRADYTGTEFEPGALADPGNFFEWNGSYPEPEFDPAGIPITDIDTRQNGFYAATRLTLAEPLKLIAGARFSTFKTDYFYLYDTSEGIDYDYRKTVPYAGLIFDISRDFSAFASFTQIFKPQSSRNVDGALLDPIDGRSFEVGIKGEHFGGRLNTSLTLFETRQNNVATAVYDPDTGEAVLLPDGTQASQGIDGTKTKGFELETSGEILPGWNASLGWSHYQLEDANGDDVRTFIPRTLVRAFTTWQLPGALSALTIGGGVNLQSSSRTFVGFPDGGTTLEQGSLALVSLMARYQLTPNASVQINGDNLLDKKYFTLDEYDNTYFGEPLRVKASFQVRF